MFGHSVPHGCQVHHGRNTSEVLEKDSRWRERHLGFILLLLPILNVLDVFLFCVKAIAVTDCCLQ